MASLNGTLTFQRPTIEDEGIYQCFAKNKHGFSTFPPLTVKRSFLEGFKDDSIYTVDAQEGQSLKFECKAPNGYPKPTVYWMIQTQSGELHTIEDTERKILDPEGNLWFTRVSADDALKNAYYTCAATSSFRNEYKLGKRVQLKVNRDETEGLLNFTSPSSTVIMQYVTEPHHVVLRGQRTELFCIPSSPSNVSVSWSFNGTAINYDKRVKERNFGKSLLIRDTRVDDRGTYSCNVALDDDENNNRNQSSLIMLDVLAAPYFISHPLSKTIVENDTSAVVEFSCEVRGVPLPTIEWTHNGKKIEFTEERFSALKNKLTIKDLIKSDGGNYACNATNKLGFAYQDFYLDVVKKMTNLN